ncbi:Osmotin, thaumatin-like protein [Meira miltonrushii]|uniref:Osmotin, thaumatin-like protein n=1 Tax=Meira miltonrushii TaxID=1280837 RepID=A0A316VCM0_9BASI|nr:Osmotin, thaumatin-like protein [Meira miltonrushii]PWN35286.1 Osmotin, thaumatin-like protein [Meira miltonrushii]
MRFIILVSSIFFLALTSFAKPTVKRDNRITFTIFNNCDEGVQPIFDPSLPGREFTGQNVIKPGKHSEIHFTSDNYRGSIYTRIKGSRQDGQFNTTHGQFDIGTGKYAISIANGFNVPLRLQLQGKQEPGPDGTTQCDSAFCECKHCKDAFHHQPGLLTPKASEEPCTRPVHECPPDFTYWVVHFC